MVSSSKPNHFTSLEKMRQANKKNNMHNKTMSTDRDVTMGLLASHEDQADEDLEDSGKGSKHKTEHLTHDVPNFGS